MFEPRCLSDVVFVLQGIASGDAECGRDAALHHVGHARVQLCHADGRGRLDAPPTVHHAAPRHTGEPRTAPHPTPAPTQKLSNSTIRHSNTISLVNTQKVFIQNRYTRYLPIEY